MKKLALLAALASCAFAVQAKTPIGVLQDVSGAVSISGHSVVSRAVNGAVVLDGSSVLVSSSGKATLVLQNGCAVTLGANQHLTVDAKMPCEQISASVKHLFPAYKVAQAPITGGLPVPPQPGFLNPGFLGGGLSTSTFVIGGIAGITAVSIATDANRDPVSGQ